MFVKNEKAKINILDITIILFMLLIGFSLLASKFIFRNKESAVIRMSDKKEYIVDVILEADRAWLVKYIKTGNGQKDLENNYMAEIVGIYKKNIEDKEYNVVSVKLNAEVKESEFIVYGNNILRLGEDFVLETKDYVLKGVVYKVKEYKN